MAHWQDFNPWAAKLLYTATIDEWLDCLEFQDSRAHYAKLAKRRCDAYILPQPNGMHSMGLRFGSNGEDYFSPPCNAKAAQLLINKYQKVPV